MHGLPSAILEEDPRIALIVSGRPASPTAPGAGSSTVNLDPAPLSENDGHHHLMLIATAQVLVTLVLGLTSAAWPLHPRPEVVHGFDPPAETWDAGHRGVDLLGRPGQAVLAARGGIVTFAGSLAGRGVVVVKHGDTRTTYEPVKSSVHVGDPVVAGQRIGALQTFGSHCFPRSCLHWGLIEGETYLNPLTLVGAGPVRLLPLYSPAPVAPWPSAWQPPLRPGDVLAGRPDATGLW